MAALFTLLYPFEFAQTESSTPGRVYVFVGGGFRLIDVIILSLFALVVVTRIGTGRLFKLQMPRSVGRWVTLFSLAILMSMAHGAANGGTELFFDWRGLAIGVALMFVIYQLLRARPGSAPLAAGAILTVLAVRAFDSLFKFVTGVTNIVAHGQRLPAFDGPTLSNTVFLIIAASCLALGWKKGSPNSRMLLGVAAFLGILMVLFAFRRTYWGEAFLGLLAILLLFNKKRLSALLALVALGFVFAPFLPEAFRLRAYSANPFTVASENQYAVTNEDHVNDLLDAWDVIKKDPVLGYGLGRPYETERIEHWKFTSWGVHNALLHVWLRYGALGLVSYVSLHLATFAWLLRLSRRFDEGSFEQWWLIATFSYLVATFIVSLVASPWPYGATQNSLLMLGLIGIAFAMQHSAPNSEDRRSGQPDSRRASRLA